MADHSEQTCRRVDVGISRVFELFGKRWTGP
ncbi:transcriptional regulator, partial [Streptomyces sp. SID8455]|nr:transcriptional regulator [Streptomyces sp. SID8455]